MALLTSTLASPLASTAWAFHAGDVFDKPPGAGGADGIFYTGAPLDHGWKCDLCHQSPPGKIAVQVVAKPDLISTSQYTPGQTVQFTVNLLGEHLGLGSPKSNYNSVVVKIVDADGNAAGSLTGFAPEDFYQDYTMSTIASAGTKPNVTSWQFSWIAPAASDAGPVMLYVSAVDGDGANAGPNATLTDPFNDDFASGAFTFNAAKTGSLDRRLPRSPASLACMTGLALAGLARRRRRPRR